LTSWCVWIATAGLLACLAASARAEDIAVIGNVEGPLVGMASKDVKSVYLGERQFAGQDLIIPFHLPEGKEKAAFLAAVVGRSQKEYKLFWVRRVFQEGARLPRLASSPAEMLAQVARQRTALGYVPERLVKDAPGVTVLFTFAAP